MPPSPPRPHYQKRPPPPRVRAVTGERRQLHALADAPGAAHDDGGGVGQRQRIPGGRRAERHVLAALAGLARLARLAGIGLARLAGLAGIGLAGLAGHCRIQAFLSGCGLQGPPWWAGPAY